MSQHSHTAGIGRAGFVSVHSAPPSCVARGRAHGLFLGGALTVTLHYLLKCLCSTAMAEIMMADAMAIMLPSSKNRPLQPSFVTILLVKALIAITPQLATPLTMPDTAEA
mmetsp:Transcript_73989/g.211286  ORF Transcript_73989/g.211286 Transcript_73989/m.211286 type:complete len:110 (-) Transcript_73989:1203-1532(-)